MPTATGSTVSDGLIAHQQQMLDAIQKNTSGTITKAFSEMIAAVMPSAARFRSAYTKELQRVQDEAGDDPSDARVSLYWLVSSGMLRELVDAINDNMEKAAKETAPAIQQGQQQAAQAGQVSATAMSAQAAGVSVSKVQQPTQPAQPDEGTDETIDGLPGDTSGNAKKAIMAGVLAGLGGQALMQGVQTVLTGALQSMLGLGESSAAQAMQQGASLLISANSGLLDGWIWAAESGSCIACLEMDGSFHTWDEDMSSHPNCGCVQQPYSGPASGLDDYAGQGENYFNSLDDSEQAAILGPSKYLAWKNGDVQLMDLVSKEGGFIHERSLKDLGLDFRDYLQQLPTKRELLQLPDISLLGPHPMDAALSDEEKVLLADAQQMVYATGGPNPPGTLSNYVSPRQITLPPVNEEAQAKIVQAAKDALEAGISTPEEAQAIGQQIREYLDTRLGDVAVQGKQAIAILQKKNDLSGADIAWLFGDTTDHNGITFEEAMYQYSQALRDETVNLLGQVRDLGGEDLSIMGDANKVAAAALKDVKDAYPTDWIVASNAQGDVYVVPATGATAGAYSPSPDGTDGRIKLLPNMGPEAMYTNAAHELAHRMEDSVEGLDALEAAFYEARTADEEAVALGDKLPWKTKVDDFATAYQGREPINYTLRQADGTVRHYTSYELLSVGVEWVLGKKAISAFLLAKDEGFHEFILGILFGYRGG